MALVCMSQMVSRLLGHAAGIDQFQARPNPRFVLTKYAICIGVGGGGNGDVCDIGGCCTGRSPSSLLISCSHQADPFEVADRIGWSQASNWLPGACIPQKH